MKMDKEKKDIVKEADDIINVCAPNKREIINELYNLICEIAQRQEKDKQDGDKQ